MAPIADHWLMVRRVMRPQQPCESDSRGAPRQIYEATGHFPYMYLLRILSRCFIKTPTKSMGPKRAKFYEATGHFP
jgi:hypothetical protein